MLGTRKVQGASKLVGFDRGALLDLFIRGLAWRQSRVEWEKWEPVLGLAGSFVGSEDPGATGDENPVAVLATV